MATPDDNQTESPSAPQNAVKEERAGVNEFRIRRGRVDSLSLFEITESELHALQEGSPASLLLNFAIFCASVFVSFLVALLTTEIKSDRTYSVFVCVTIITGLAGLVLLALWWRQQKSMRSIVETIKNRLRDSD